MRKITDAVANAGAAAAIVLLLLVLAGRVVLLSSVPPALQAQTLFEASSPAAREAVRLVLVVDRGDDARASRAAQRVKMAHPGRRLDVHRISWAVPDGRRSPEAGVAALVRAYGYSELPILLTLSREGQVVRVQSFSTADDR
jgi:hypothetical protein